MEEPGVTLTSFRTSRADWEGYIVNRSKALRHLGWWPNGLLRGGGIMKSYNFILFNLIYWF
ncbi:hypothetical protein HY945_03180 [Candidatus Gottesmanbacteria bacterium]|nr:hypothetical protein [Candidatus Gottesmanbacteria bacterium]